MYIVMPAWKEGQKGWGNLHHPEVYEEEAIAHYPIGTDFVDGDRSWHYVQAGNSIVRGRVLASWNAFSTPTSGDGTTRETATIAAAVVIDSKVITCTDQGTITVANLFAGGYAMVYWEFLCLRIVSSTIEDSSGQFTVTIDRPLPVAIDSASVVSLYRDKYADVRYLTSGSEQGWASGVCVPNYTKTDTKYFWGQTWGPCGLAGTDNIGATAGERGIYRMHDGSVFVTTGIHASNNQPAYQHIGYVIPYTGDITGYDQPGAFIHVQLQLER
jgi:hypothetical protein